MSARANLILHSLLPSEDLSKEELWRQHMEGRYAEIRMLFYVGKDLGRWLDQCLEVVARDEQLRQAGIQRQSFAALLVEDPPVQVHEKLRSWGVVEYQAIFRRAMGLNAVFAEVPAPDSLAEDFLRFHNRYADCFFECLVQSVPFARVNRADFHFELHASGEYAKLIEKQWESG